MSGNQMMEAPKRSMSDKVFTILWFGAVLAFGIVLPFYFTITQTGTAAWLIRIQAWIYMKLTGTPEWHPVITGIVTAVIHVFVFVGIVKGISGLAVLFRKRHSKKSR